MSLIPAAPEALQQYDYSAGLAELRKQFGDRVLTSESVREQAGKDESFHPTMPPHAVIRVRSREEVQEVVKICARTGMPVVPHGAGTSLEGNIAALKGGVTIDFTDMNEVVAVHAGDFRRRGAARGHPPAVERVPEGPGPVFSHRSGCQRHGRRHDRHPGLRHQRGALRHHAGQCHQYRGSAGGRVPGADRAAGAQVCGRL